MLFIGICGASGSGKSTLAEELATMVNRSILIINQDAYYLDHPNMTFEERCAINYDEPSVFDHDLLLSDVQHLLSGPGSVCPANTMTMPVTPGMTGPMSFWSRTTCSLWRAFTPSTIPAFGQ